MTQTRRIAIVGAGMAGGRAAEALRQLGFEGELTIFGDENQLPYERPPLSKNWLLGRQTDSSLLLRPITYLDDHRIEVHPDSRVEQLDLHARRLRTGGEWRSYDRLLLATGARARRLTLPGADLGGVLTLRSMEDGRGLRARLAPGLRVVVAGAGLLGLELAAALRQLSCEITVVETASGLRLPFGATAGEHLLGLHSDNGVQIRWGSELSSFEGRGTVEAVRLRDGSLLACDLAIVCVGSIPNSELAAEAGLETDPGVLVSDRLETSVPGVFAAGDLASWRDGTSGSRQRLEHYDNAHQQGLYVAASMLGSTAPYRRLPYFWTEQYQSLVQMVGKIRGSATALMRGDPQSNSFAVVYTEGGRVTACTAVNRYRDLSAARALINAGTEVDPGAVVLAEQLRELAPPG